MALPLDDENVWQTFLGYIRIGKTFGSACRAVKMNTRAVAAYLQGNPLRAAEYLDAERQATDVIEEVLYEEARSKQKWAVQMWLERRDRERWAPAAVDQGPAKIVLDPAALKGMRISSGSDVGASVVEDDGVPAGLPPADVVLAEVPDPDASLSLEG